MMNTIKLLSEIRSDGGAIWMENESIKLLTSEKLHTGEIKNFITINKNEIISLLKENSIFSKDIFSNSTILKNSLIKDYPLSPAQERLWFIEQYEKGTNAYHIPRVYELNQETNIEAVKYALRKIVSRHEILRTTIERSPGQSTAIQVVHDNMLFIDEFEAAITDDYKPILQSDINRPFDLSKDYPIRVKLYFLNHSESINQQPHCTVLLLINIHHIASDGWSMEIFQQEFRTYYEAYIRRDTDFDLPELEIQYKDYSVWQRNYLNENSIGKQLNYWRENLSGYQALEMPTDYVRPNTIDYKGASIEFAVGESISEKLRSLAKVLGVTLHSIMLSTVSILLGKYSGQKDILTGSPAANRHHQQTEALIGFFVNMQVNRILLKQSQSFRDLVRQVDQSQIDSKQNQDIPFEKLVNEFVVERNESMHPLFQVTFGVQGFGSRKKIFRQTKDYFKPYQFESGYQVEKFDLSVIIDDSDDELMGQISYATSLFKQETIEQFIRHYIHLLDILTQDPDKHYSEVSLLDKKEYHKIIYEWNATDQEYPNHLTIHELIETNVLKMPEAVAVIYMQQRLTYKELNEKSNQLARHIREEYKRRTSKEFAADTLIAICVEKSLEMVVSMLAVLKAGAAYVPIDPDYPKDRINYILQDTGVELILSHHPVSKLNQEKLPQDKLLEIHLESDLYSDQIKSNLSIKKEANNLAYVIYTSGTTGKPKGVMLEHRNLVNLVFNQIAALEINLDSNVLQFASIVFDASVWEIFSCLSAGGKLFIVSPDIRQDANSLCDYLFTNKISLALLPPVLLSSMPLKPLPFLKTLIVGGDTCTSEVMNVWSNGRRLINAYGPTESTVISSMHTYVKGDSSRNIGKPLSNLRMYVLDENQNPLPAGVKGELYLGGAGIARGYLNREELTSARFISNPFAKEEEKSKWSSRLYRTGDMVKWQADGSLEYMGRNDDQVKIRGYRIELSEVETVLLQIEGISQACVQLRKRKVNQGTEFYLVGYYVLSDKGAFQNEVTIHEQLMQVLPAYMVPAALMEMKYFPLTINGKVDKRALPDPEFNFCQTHVEASTEEEKISCRIWEEILGIERVGITDDFFRIGGSSVLAIHAAYQMSIALTSDFKVDDIFRYKTINQLLKQRQNKEGSKLVKPYTSENHPDIPKLIFIHPGSGGCEVYQRLAELIGKKFNCIGIDNYNIHNEKKIADLNKLAAFYLSELESEYSISEPVNILGWSLGGNIALEMAAILESRGYKSINLVLLDTVIPDDFFQSLATKTPKEELVNIYRNQITAQSQLEYAEKVISAIDAEQKLSLTSQLSFPLKQTQIKLFKALKKDTRFEHEVLDAASLHTLSLMKNNIERVADHIEVINLECEHGNILETNSLYISQCIMTKGFL